MPKATAEEERDKDAEVGRLLAAVPGRLWTADPGLDLEGAALCEADLGRRAAWASASLEELWLRLWLCPPNAADWGLARWVGLSVGLCWLASLAPMPVNVEIVMLGVLTE